MAKQNFKPIFEDVKTLRKYKVPYKEIQEIVKNRYGYHYAQSTLSNWIKYESYKDYLTQNKQKYDDLKKNYSRKKPAELKREPVIRAIDTSKNNVLDLTKETHVLLADLLDIAAELNKRIRNQ